MGNEVKRYTANSRGEIHGQAGQYVLAAAFDAQSAEIFRLRAEVGRIRDEAVTNVHRSWAAERVEWQATIARLEAEARGMRELFAVFKQWYDGDIGQLPFTMRGQVETWLPPASKEK